MSASSSAEPSPDIQLDPDSGSAGLGPKGKGKRARARPLTRDEVIEIRALRKYAKMTHEQIVAATPFTINQVQVACKNTSRWQKKPDRWSNAKSWSSGAGGGSAEGSLAEGVAAEQAEQASG